MSSHRPNPSPSVQHVDASRHAASRLKSPGHHSSQHHNHSYAHLTHEERLSKVWRHLASSIVAVFAKAEKAAENSTKENCKELDEAVVSFLRTRVEWHRLISQVEAKLQGKAQEREALECYVRTQPRLGKRKRDEETTAELESAMLNAAAPTQPPAVPAPPDNFTLGSL